MRLVDIVLRPGRREDSRSIRGLIREVGINPFQLDWRRFVVALDSKEKLIGCGQIKSHFDGSRELASIAVRDGFRRQGVAAAIIGHLLRDNIRPLFLLCRRRLAHFYAAFGFSEADFTELTSYYRILSSFMKPFAGRARREDQPVIMRLNQ